MEVIKNIPEPTPPPPATYDLTGLTQDEVNTIRQSLYHVSKAPQGGLINNHKGRARKLHRELYKAMTGQSFEYPYE